MLVNCREIKQDYRLPMFTATLKWTYSEMMKINRVAELHFGNLKTELSCGDATDTLLLISQHKHTTQTDNYQVKRNC